MMKKKNIKKPLSGLKSSVKKNKKLLATIVVAILGLSLTGVLLTPDADKTAPGITPPGPTPTPGKTTLCSDTDNGNDVFTTGVITLGSTKNYEKCIDVNTVLEYFCENNKIQIKSLPCPTGYVCNTGACVIQASKKSICYDSDDGKSFDVAGVVFHNEKNYPDKCVSANEVKEYYCEAGKPLSIKQSCSTGFSCVDNRCQPTPTECSDTDAKNYKLAGKVDDGIKTYNDMCVDTDTLTEYYCDVFTVKSIAYSCKNAGLWCSLGACITEPLCKDPDRTSPSYVSQKTTVTKGHISLTDTCKDSTTLKEANCKAGVANYDEITCAVGCVNGACAIP
tara:strand:- start:698 stop:1702 length:1005 start_codon:yes stop_codon:yes gene_type:complete